MTERVCLPERMTRIIIRINSMIDDADSEDGVEVWKGAG